MGLACAPPSEFGLPRASCVLGVRSHLQALPPLVLLLLDDPVLHRQRGLSLAAALPFSPRYLHRLLVLILIALQGRRNALGHVSGEASIDDEEVLLGLCGVW